MTEPIQIKYFLPQNGKGISLSTTEYRTFRFPKHFHQHYTFLLVEEGVNEGFTEKDKYHVGTGGVLIIHPGDLHAGNSWHNDYLRFTSIRLETDFVKGLCANNEWSINGEIRFPTQPIYDNHLTDLMVNLIKAMRQSNGLFQEEKLVAWWGYLIRKYNNQVVKLKVPSCHPSLNRALEYLHAHYQEPISLKELAKTAFLSPYHLVRQFKKTFGLTPFQYLRNLRVERAKSRLIKGEISDVANAVGFFDHSHFTRNYKQIEGVPPSVFTKNQPPRGKIPHVFFPLGGSRGDSAN